MCIKLQQNGKESVARETLVSYVYIHDAVSQPLF